MEECPPILGIDLGTTFSCVSIFQNGKSIIIPNDLGERTTPSYVSFFENNERLVGTLAKERILEKQKIVYSSKRLIGRKYQDEEIQNDIKYLPFKIIEDKNRERVKIKIEGLGDLIKTEYYPEEISSMILQKIKKDAEFYLKRKELKEVVITTPAYFNQKQRISTKQAAEIAGLKVIKMINEPTAASVAYAFLEKEKLGDKNLIFDFGGGTLDLTLLSFSKKEKIYCQILCSSGDTHLGGQDIDNLICDKILEKYNSKINKFIQDNHLSKNDIDRAKLRLLKACEKGKILLSFEKEAIIFVDSFLSINIKETLKREDFDIIMTDFFNKKIKKCIEQFLKKCNLKQNQIENIIFVGGSSKIPILKDLIQNIFTKSKILSTINPDEVVAIGAGIIGAQLNGDKALEDLNLYDVTSLSLGTNIKGGIMDIIIPKSTPFPVKKKKIYYTIRDDQEEMSNQVYEGEELKLEDNYLLGDFKISNLTKRKKGKTSIELEFELTSNYLLKVKAKELNRNDDKLNEKKDKVKLEEPKGFFKIDEIKDLKNWLKKENKNELEDIYINNYQEKLIHLKENLYNNSNKYSCQLEIIKYLDQFLSNFDQTKFDDKYKTLYYKVYTLYVVLFFIEINKLILFKKNISFKEINEIVLDFNLEKKIENIKFTISDIIWELLDICSSNILFYNYLKLKIIKIFFENINFSYLSINFGIVKFSEKLMDYQKTINKLETTILEYINKLKEIGGNENIIGERNINLSFLEKLKKGLKVKKFITDFNLLGLSNHSAEEYIKDAQEYLINYFNYDLELTSPEYIQLQQIYKTLETYLNNAAPTITNEDEYEINKYVNMVKECINGKYHGKQDYTKDIDEIDNDQEDDEDNKDDENGEEKAFRKLSNQEQELIKIIKRTKEETEKKLETIYSSNKKQALTMIAKEIKKKKTDFNIIWDYYDKDQFDNLKNYIISIYKNEKRRIKTIRDLEEKIIDDVVLTRINSIIS